MSMQDTLADMFTRIRNAQMATKETVTMPSSNLKTEVARVLKQEGYINDFTVTEGAKPQLAVTLKYFEGKPVIEHIQRFSKPSLRSYKGKDALPKVADGLGIAIVTTSQGVMTDRAARQAGVGGEVICTVF
ncbi:MULTISPECIES: 30S ribosomal protein S8 [Chromohalobacter]|uniref:Small ribosomal subunit protein uS8 n=1 Tax=Chromohalobacter israelensis (strain ATCC BAA-138 / DSM 3043 / CIP 106854 / NCIMB 13768 / 1H11) TaxID=290398 RepID=RS8_CHRI1|nr:MULTISPECIES: 30S ribosomal protein S8 [Chromohalobacter]Q1R0G1.1 RecName: Full=Small ribosomal subunit protein uS8; AltName: Full=30S ribosomal protein S8 [Chromohalobacter salexigens DSM 3043]ABE57797.1 SSU ribosomal protein S8P [Chromohalobacter salexigens DSM 3043]MBZ5877739.1 30S ribosomal protein S8 [Chromohalobacter salexigens]MDF9435768.1 30S ribosomal protein S8 [Chromohalobacter israelensis]MDO0947357.1 30S ribosomal protein S8 [Chromohalobacter salexigens]NQY47415.1 30S ribosoma